MRRTEFPTNGCYSESSSDEYIHKFQNYVVQVDPITIHIQRIIHITIRECVAFFWFLFRIYKFELFCTKTRTHVLRNSFCNPYMYYEISICSFFLPFIV